jgi:hypothetical protein
MKTFISLLAMAAVFGIGPVSQAHAQQCSNAVLRGSYGFHALATIVSPGSAGTPRSIIGVFTMDGRGNWTTSLIINDNGVISHRPDTGTYVVNADCTGTFFPASGGTVEIVVVDGGNEFYQMRSNPASIVMYAVSKKLSSGAGGEN